MQRAKSCQVSLGINETIGLQGGGREGEERRRWEGRETRGEGEERRGWERSEETRVKGKRAEDAKGTRDTIGGQIGRRE